jgi:hypothetical protein
MALTDYKEFVLLYGCEIKNGRKYEAYMIALSTMLKPSTIVHRESILQMLKSKFQIKLVKDLNREEGMAMVCAWINFLRPLYTGIQKRRKPQIRNILEEKLITTLFVLMVIHYFAVTINIILDFRY